jgi:hypothetical protein
MVQFLMVRAVIFYPRAALVLCHARGKSRNKMATYFCFLTASLQCSARFYICICWRMFCSVTYLESLILTLINIYSLILLQSKTVSLYRFKSFNTRGLHSVVLSWHMRSLSVSVSLCHCPWPPPHFSSWASWLFSEKPGMGLRPAQWQQRKYMKDKGDKEERLRL